MAPIPDRQRRAEIESLQAEIERLQQPLGAEEERAVLDAQADEIDGLQLRLRAAIDERPQIVKRLHLARERYLDTLLDSNATGPGSTQARVRAGRSWKLFRRIGWLVGIAVASALLASESARPAVMFGLSLVAALAHGFTRGLHDRPQKIPEALLEPSPDLETETPALPFDD